MRALTKKLYDAMMFMACLSMLAAFITIMLGIAVREFAWNIQGLDAYAGYSIASALFLALPATLRNGDHIRVTLLIQKVGDKTRTVLEYWSLGAALVLSTFFAWYACRLVWVSYLTHDVSPAADASPLWIPQLSMALGCIGLAIAFAEALWSRIQNVEFIVQGASANME